MFQKFLRSCCMMRIRTLLTAVVFLIAATVMYSQHPRMVLLEEFTAMTCPPCAQAKPIVKQFTDGKEKDGILFITYHMDYPAPGDPFNVYNNSHNQTRHSYYGITGIPYGAINGSKTNVFSLAAMQAAAQAIQSKESPLLVTVSEDRSKTPVEITVTVKNDGSLALPGLVLHTALLTHYVDLTEQLKTASNVQYREFENAMLKMFPNANGATFSIAAGETKKFTYTYSPGTGDVWAPGQQFVTAFVQVPNTKEVLQAGTDFFDISTNVSIESTTANYLTTPRNSQISKEFTLTNDKDKPVTAKVELVANNTILPTGWSATLDKSTVTIPAKGTATVTLSGSSADNGGFLFSTLKVTPQSNGLNIESSYNFGYLADNTKCGVLIGYSTGGAVDFNAALGFSSSKFNKDYALMPLADEVLNAYSPLPFQGIILPVDYDHRGALYSSPGLCTMLGNLMQNGTRLLITSALDAYNVFDNTQATPSYPSRTFLNSLGIAGTSTGNPIQRFTQSGNTITPTAFSIRGLSGDVVGGGVTFSCNKPLQTHPYWDPYTDPLKLVSGTKASVPFLYFDQSSNIAGVRTETENSRAIFLSFSIDAMESAGSRNTFVAKMMDWLMAPLSNAPAPDISLLYNGGKNSVDFGEVEAGKSKQLSFDIKNTGTADLTVTGAEWSDPVEDPKVFSIVSGGTFPMVIKAGEKSTMTLEFKPKGDADIITALTFTSDAKSGDATIGVFAKSSGGATSVEPNTSSDGLVSVTVGPNPFSEQTTVRYNVYGNVPQMVRVQLVDALGNTVQTLANTSLAPGGYTVGINAATLAAGTYRVVVNAGTSSTFMPVVVVK